MVGGQKAFDIANRWLFFIHGFGTISLLTLLTPFTGPFASFFVFSASPANSNFSLALFLIVPVRLVIKGWIDGSNWREPSFFIAMTYLVIYMTWMTLPGGTSTLADGGIAANKPVVLFSLILTIPTVAFVLTIRNQRS